MEQVVVQGLLSLSIVLEFPEGQARTQPVLKELLFAAKELGLDLDFKVLPGGGEGEAVPRTQSVLTLIGHGSISATALSHIAQVLAGRTPRFIGITGGSGYLGYRVSAHNPDGLAVPIPEDAKLVEDRSIDNFGFMIADTERQLMAAHQRGDFKVTILRYPRVYGPRQLIPNMWPIVKRALDRPDSLVAPRIAVAGWVVACTSYIPALLVQ